MGRKAILVCEELRESEQRLTAILDFFGIRWEKASAQALREIRPEAQSYCLFSAMDVLGRALQEDRNPGFLLQNAHSTFLFGSDDRKGCLPLLHWLTQDDSTSLKSASSGKLLCSIANETDVCGAMSGLQVPVVARNEQLLTVPLNHRLVPLISSPEGCVFAASESQNMRCFIAPSATLVDITRPVGKAYFDVADYFCGSVPLVMYLRYAFAESMPTPAEQGACLIVDDPVLRPQYGFFDFARIAALSSEHRFSCSVAFIPWNWRRSHRSVVELFRRDPERLSLSVHGCDHTAGEFGSTSVPQLIRQSKLAIQRMEFHRQSTGLEYEPVMVFPQGSFSSVSPGILKHSGFIAAVNTEVSPVDQQPSTPISELWKTAILKYGNFAIFTRRYPSHGLHNFAFDLLLGKPCLIVTHHSDFRDDSRRLMELIDQLNSLGVPLAWRTLGNVVRRAYQEQVQDNGIPRIQMFGSEIMVENREPSFRAITVEKAESSPEGIDRVEAGGRPISYACEKGILRFKVRLDAGQRMLVRTAYKDIYGKAERQRRPVSGSAKVLVRRCLSEFRDETEARAPWIHHCAKNVRDWLARPPINR